MAWPEVGQNAATKQAFRPMAVDLLRVWTYTGRQEPWSRSEVRRGACERASVGSLTPGYRFGSVASD